MLKITTNQARSRFQILPPELQNGILSAQTAEIIRSVCEQNRVPADKVRVVANEAGLVFLGFIHPGDLAQEIKEAANLPAQTADSISSSLNTKVFQAIKEKLDEIYAPVPHEETASPTLEEIRKTQPVGMPVFITPSEGPRQTPSESAPTTPSALPVKPAAPTAPTPEKKSMGEFAKMGLGSTTPPPIKTGSEPPSVRPPASQEPPPMMIFGETASKPSPAASQFKSGIPIPEFKEAASAPPPRPAVIEFRGMEKPVAPPKAPERPMPRVVHYTEFSTPLDTARGEPPKAPEVSLKSAPQKPGPTTPTPPTPPPPPPMGPTKVDLPKFSTPTDIRKPTIAPGAPPRPLNVPPPPDSKPLQKPNLDIPELPAE